LKKITVEKNVFFLDKKQHFTYPLASIKDVQVTKETFSSKKEHPAFHDMKFLSFWIRIWILNTDPDPNPLT
jgi:hypothetical protein